MKKILLGISLFSLVLLALLAYSSHVFAEDERGRFHQDRDNHNNRLFNPDKQLSKQACGERLGSPIINVDEKVQNDVDSGFGATVWWAFDYYTRHIQVWQTSPVSTESATATYCAIVTYEGQFYAVPGQVGPGNNPSGAVIDSPVNGPMSGGYRETFKGTLSGTPAWPTHGNVGTVNYHCNITGTCTGTVDWVNQYFPGYTNFDQPWWGWQYKGGNHGTWTNAIDVTQPNSGNIL